MTLHLGLHLLPVWQHDLWRIGDDRPAFRPLREQAASIPSLLANLDRFAHLQHAHGVSRHTSPSLETGTSN